MHEFKNLCRFCGQKDGQFFYNIFDSNHNLIEKIQKCLHLEMSSEDYKPKQICNPCFNKINDFSNFVDVCFSTNSKLESIYYTETWYPVNTPKQSVIVSNRQSHDLSSQFYQQANGSGITGILLNYDIPQSDNILDFSVNYNSTQQKDIQNCYNECNTYNKEENIKKDVSPLEERRTVSSCLLNENDPNTLLDSVEDELNIIDNTLDNTTCSNEVTKSVLVSVDTVRNSLNTNSLLLPENSNSNAPKKSYLCPHCDKKFVRRSNLNAHISVHTKIRPYKCLSCTKTFAIKCHLTQHKKTHMDIFRCHICHKNFDVPSKLSRHMHTHNKHKPFVCCYPNCNKGFSDKHNLNQHIQIHSTEKKFSCVICMKLFKTQKNLKAHITVHVNNSKFECKFCQKVFKYNHNLKAHIIRHKNKVNKKIQ